MESWKGCNRHNLVQVFVLLSISFKGLNAVDRYVSLSGSDDKNDCVSSTQACRTMQQATSVAQNGDSILVDGSQPLQGYSFHDIVTKNQNITFQAWMKRGALLQCTSTTRMYGNIRCNANFENSSITFVDLDISGCAICILDSNLEANNTRFLSAQLIFRVHRDSSSYMHGAFFQDSIIQTSSKCESKGCQNETTLNLIFKRTEFVGPEMAIQNHGGIQHLMMGFSEVMFEGLQQGIHLNHFRTLYFFMADSIVQNWKSDTGFILGASQDKEMGVQIRNTTFMDNEITKGGVVALETDSPIFIEAIVNNCTFENNTSDMAGSSLRLDLDPLAVNQSVVVTNTRFLNNINFESAAGISTTGGTVRVAHSHFINNHVATLASREGSTSERKGAGGAINFLSTAVLVIDECHFCNNTANWFGGSLAGSGAVDIKNSKFDNSDVGVHATVGDIMFLTGEVKFTNLTIRAITTELNLALIWYSSTYQLKADNTSYLDLHCPTGSQFRNESLPVINTTVVAYKDLFLYCDPCLDGTYSLQQGYRTGSLDWNAGHWSEDFKCHKCSYGGDCKDGVIRSKVNFWGFESEGNTTVHLIPCPEGYCCADEVCESYNTCAADRIGTLCGECKEGMGEILFSPECVDNSECTASWYIVVDIGISFVYLLFFLYQVETTALIMKYLFWQDSTEADDASSAGYIKSIFYFYQTIDLLNVQENQALNEVGVALQPFVTYLLSFKPLAAVWGVCPFPGLTPVTKTLLNSAQTLYMFVMLGIMLAVTQLVEVVKQRKRTVARNTSTSWLSGNPNIESFTSEETTDNGKFKARLATACVSLFLYNYISISNVSFKLLACFPLGDEYVLYYDGNVECIQPWQLIFIFIIAIHVAPFFCVVIVSRTLLESRQISNRQFIISYFLPLPMLSYWFFRWVYFKLRQMPLNNNINNRFNESESLIAEPWEPNQENIKHEILFVVEEPFINHQDTSKSTKYWEGVMIFRRLILCLLAVLVFDSMLGLTLQTMACLAFLIWHIHAHPFGTKSANHLETISLTLLTMISTTHLIQATFFSAGALPEGPSKLQIYTTDWIEAILINALPLLFILLLAISILVRLGYVLYKGGYAVWRLTCRNRCCS